MVESVIGIKNGIIVSVVVSVKTKKKMLIYDILYETLIGAKPLRFRFDKVFYILYYLVLKNMILFTIALDILSVKKVVLHIFLSDNYARIRIDSYDSLDLEKTLTFHNVTILINSFNFNLYYDYFVSFRLTTVVMITKIIS